MGPKLLFVLVAHNEAENLEVLGVFGAYVGRALCDMRGSPVDIIGRTEVDDVRPTEAAAGGFRVYAVR